MLGAAVKATLVIAIVTAAAMRLAEPQSALVTLTGFASLAADTFSAGPTSGQFIAAANGITPPFLNKQTVQGFSAILRARDGSVLAMPDNGFGSKANSPDHVLRVYRIAVDVKTRTRGSGTIVVQSFISLHDPDGRLGFPITAERETYPGPPEGIAVDAAIRKQRLLTGADIDIESMREAPDGTLWFGDEFGPFLLHTDATGKVLDPPISLDGARAPQNPFGGAATLAASRGFEGIALTPAGDRLYAMLEGSLAGEDPRHLRISEFDLRRKQFTGERWTYPLDVGSNSIGDITAVTNRTFLIIERDDLQGDAARFKKVFRVNLDERDGAGLLRKREVVDLLDLADPDRLGGKDARFRFPFQTIESLIVLGPNQLGLINDNNYPFSSGRAAGKPDPNEFIVVSLSRTLN